MNRLEYLIKRTLVRLKKGEIKEILNKIFQTLINDNKIITGTTEFHKRDLHCITTGLSGDAG